MSSKTKASLFSSEASQTKTKHVKNRSVDEKNSSHYLQNFGTKTINSNPANFEFKRSGNSRGNSPGKLIKNMKEMRDISFSHTKRENDQSNLKEFSKERRRPSIKQTTPPSVSEMKKTANIARIYLPKINSCLREEKASTSTNSMSPSLVVDELRYLLKRGEMNDQRVKKPNDGDKLKASPKLSQNERIPNQISYSSKREVDMKSRLHELKKFQTDKGFNSQKEVEGANNNEIDTKTKKNFRPGKILHDQFALIDKNSENNSEDLKTPEKISKPVVLRNQRKISTYVKKADDKAFELASNKEMRSVELVGTSAEGGSYTTNYTFNNGSDKFSFSPISGSSLENRPYGFRNPEWKKKMEKYSSVPEEISRLEKDSDFKQKSQGTIITNKNTSNSENFGSDTKEVHHEFFSEGMKNKNSLKFTETENYRFPEDANQNERNDSVQDLLSNINNSRKEFLVDDNIESSEGMLDAQIREIYDKETLEKVNEIMTQSKANKFVQRQRTLTEKFYGEAPQLDYSSSPNYVDIYTNFASNGDEFYSFNFEDDNYNMCQSASNSPIKVYAEKNSIGCIETEDLEIGRDAPSETPTNLRFPPLQKYLSQKSNRTPQKLYKQLEFDAPESPNEKKRDRFSSEEDSDKILSFSPSHFGRKASLLSNKDKKESGLLDSLKIDRGQFKTMEMIKSDRDDDDDREKEKKDDVNLGQFAKSIVRKFNSKDSQENLLQSIQSFESDL